MYLCISYLTVCVICLWTYSLNLVISWSIFSSQIQVKKQMLSLLENLKFSLFLVLGNQTNELLCAVTYFYTTIHCIKQTYQRCKRNTVVFFWEEVSQKRLLGGNVPGLVIVSLSAFTFNMKYFVGYDTGLCSRVIVSNLNRDQSMFLSFSPKPASKKQTDVNEAHLQKHYIKKRSFGFCPERTWKDHNNRLEHQ